MDNEPSELWLRTGAAAQFLGVSPDTLRRWEKAGHITPMRTPTGERRFLRAELQKLLDRKPAA